MIPVLATALLLLAAPPPAADLSWLIDAEIPARIAAAEAEAVRLDAQAAESDRLRKDVLARRQAALAEKAVLEPTLASLSRGKRNDAEKRIAELDRVAEAQGVREKQLLAEGNVHRLAAQARRAFASAADGAAKARAAEDARFRLEPDADLGGIPDVRLADIAGYHRRRTARLPKQLAALDEELEVATTPARRGDVVARKEAARAVAAEDEAAILRIADELRFRAESKSDEAAMARQMEEAARAKEAERTSPTPTAAPADRAAVDAMLDRVLAEQDRKAAASASASKTLRTVLRILAALAGIGALGAVLVFVLRRV